jgi:hypothetical protein
MSTPEEASEYLSRTNFKSVIEWMTAEAILNRPDDPVSFCRNLLDMKIEARGSTPFAPEQVYKISMNNEQIHYYFYFLFFLIYI